jgi:hypothetical protein
MEELGHLLERFFIHFASATFLVLAVMFALNFIRRKFDTVWLPRSPLAQLLFAAVIVFALAVLREAYDVATGQQFAKALTDYMSWALGAAVAVVGLYRFAMIVFRHGRY